MASYNKLDSFREISESQDLTIFLVRRWPEAIIILDNAVDKLVRCIIDIPYTQKNSPGENFGQFHQCLLLANFFFFFFFFQQIFLHSENFDTFA